MYLPKNISILRKRAGLSQTQLGKILGKTNSQISLYEKGENSPTIESLVKIAALFEVSLDNLMFKDFEEELPIPSNTEGSEDDPDFGNLPTSSQSLYRIVRRLEKDIYILKSAIKVRDPDLSKLMESEDGDDDY